MIRLHDFAASANCFKVRMLLSQLGLPYECVPVDIFAGDAQTADYLALNPAGRTPLLVTEDGSAIPESGYELAASPAVAAWLERVAATPGAIDDLQPYPAAAQAGAGGRSAHDR